MKKAEFGVKADRGGKALKVARSQALLSEWPDRRFWWADGYWPTTPAESTISPVTSWYTWAKDSRLSLPDSWDGPAAVWGEMGGRRSLTVRSVGEHMASRGVFFEVCQIEPDDAIAWVFTEGAIVVDSPWWPSMMLPSRARGGLVRLPRNDRGNVPNADRMRLAIVVDGVGLDSGDDYQEGEERPWRLRIKVPFGRKFGSRGFISMLEPDFVWLMHHGARAFVGTGPDWNGESDG